MSVDVNKEFGFIKPLVSDDTTVEQLYIFSVKLCNNEIDSDFDKLTPEFLTQFAEGVTASPIPLIKDHCWSAENQVGRVYRAEVITDGVNSLGEPFAYVLGYAYVAADNTDIVNRVKLGLLSEVSVGFDGKHYTCSTCGDDVLSYDYQCPNKHVFGSEFDGVPVYRNVGECAAVLECSFVPVPAQEGAEVETKSDKKEGFTLKRSDFMKRLGIKSKKSEDTTPAATAAPEIPADAAAEDVTDADIEQLIAENAALRQENAELKGGIAAEQESRLKAAVGKAIDGLNPSELFTGKLKDTVMGDCDMSKLKLKEDDTVEGIEELLEALQADYPGLFATVADAEPEAESETKADKPDTETPAADAPADGKPEDKAATKARTPHVVERPAGQTIKARVNHATGTSSQSTKARVPYATECAAQ